MRLYPTVPFSKHNPSLLHCWMILVWLKGTGTLIHIRANLYDRTCLTMRLQSIELLIFCAESVGQRTVT